MSISMTGRPGTILCAKYIGPVKKAKFGQAPDGKSKDGKAPA